MGSEQQDGPGHNLAMVNTNLVDILIVDDREDGLIAMEAVLSALTNLNVVRARSGVEALDLLPLYDFAVILLDVQMPILDGFQTAQLVRKKYEKYKVTPIIFVTAINKDDQYIYKGYDAGAVDYIFKPFEPQILCSKVSVFVDLHLKSKQILQQAETIRENERRERYLKLAELEVESLKRYRSLADAIPHIVWKSNLGGTLDYFNKVWSDYTGFTQEQSVGSGWQDAIHPEDLNAFLKLWIQSITQNKAFEAEVRIRSRQGDMKWHLVSAVPEIRHDEVTAWLGTCTNIHDRKLSEKKILQAQNEAVSANLAKTHFLANMSHEIRTPMSAILGFAELMQDPSQTEEQRSHCISTIHRNGSQLLAIIDEILDISKVETGNLEVEIIQFSLLRMLQELQGLFLVQVEKKGLQLAFFFDTPIPEFIYSDPTRVRQILMNVVGNAIKFTEAGQILVNVQWHEKGEATHEEVLEVFVKDSGVGIDQSQINRLFQPFAQVDSSTTRRFGGTGLGLALSRKLAQALGGNVLLERTELGKGSTFNIFVNAPSVKGVKMIEKFPVAEHKDNKPLFKNSPENQILKGVRILLVDDASDNQTVIGLFLTLTGAEVSFANNGIEGVEKAISGNFDIVLMDIQMPLLDGYEATKRLRQQGFHKPILALTAHALKEERERCLNAGCTEHFTKPVDRKKLIELVDRLVRAGRVALAENTL